MAREVIQDSISVSIGDRDPKLTVSMAYFLRGFHLSTSVYRLPTHSMSIKSTDIPATQKSGIKKEAGSDI
ncbi:hypothetical protein K3495_g6992 [Podosphaera aphanis]|nr:hypothetical protein K3495_g6992 [Podosphaera aphanis]